MITGEQLRGARAMARIEQTDLAARAGVSVDTIKRVERVSGPVSANTLTLDAIRKVLEGAGIEFTNGGEPGVKMRRFVIGDRVAFRPQTSDRPVDVGANEIGTVVYVEPSPPQTSAGYTVHVQFSDNKPLIRWGHDFRFAETEGA